MTTVEVFDPPMCCSSGVCGPVADPALARFSADLFWLRGKGVSVERYNLSQQPQAFVANAVVKAALAKEGKPCLPLILVNGGIASQGGYPSREELAKMSGVGIQEHAPGIDTAAAAPLPGILDCCG